MSHETSAELPGFSGFGHPPEKSGEVEAAVREQVDALKDKGLISTVHAGSVALAITTAKAVDRAHAQRGAASGFANLSRALKEALEALPALENIQADDQFEKMVAAILAESDPTNV